MPPIIRFDSFRRLQAGGRRALAAGLLFLTLSAARSAEWQTLRGHVPAAPALRAMRRLEGTNQLRLAIGLPLRRQRQLDQLLQDLYDPASPGFRQFLEPGQFAERFGPSADDYEAVAAFAASNHLTVTARHANRMVLDVIGAVADIEKALHLRLQVYAHPTEAREFFAPDTEPQLDLATPVLHIAGLDDFVRPRAMSHPVAAGHGEAPPVAQAGSGPAGSYAGRDFRAAYASGVTNTGTGQSVGLLEFGGYIAGDISRYEINYSLPNVTLSNVLIDGVNLGGNATGVEAPLDIEMVISMAPGISKVIIYYGSAGDDILSAMANANAVRQISSSWTYGIDATTLQLYQQLAAQGQSYFNCAGDVDAYTTSVAAPVDAPYLTCVGGTFLSTTGPGGAWLSESAWNRGNGVGSGGGVSLTYALPLWQQGVGMDANGGSIYRRNFPDVAMVADYIWAIYDNGNSGSYGGTSCSAPLWAGFMALVNQQAAANGQKPVGFLNPALYALGKSAGYAPAFHDIIAGNNFSSASPNQYSAVAGYDLCTGWGSPKGLNLINALALSPFNPLVVTPASGLAMAGPKGGPFLPAPSTMTLSNIGGSSLGWSVVNTSSWYTVSPALGNLGAGGSAGVTVGLSSAASNFAPGFYASTLVFTNKTNALALTRPVNLVVGSAMVWDSRAAGGPAQDGAGVWAGVTSGSSGSNWYNGAGDLAWSNNTPDLAIFGAGSGAAGVVTLGSAITTAGLNFAAPGSGNYTIADGGYALTLNGNIVANQSANVSAPITLGQSAIFSVATGQTLTVSGVLAGSGGAGLTVLGPGTVALTGPNNLGLSNGMAGSVLVSSGTLSLNAGGSQYGTLGNAAGIVISAGATLALLDSNDLSGAGGLRQNITLNGGTLTDLGLNQAIGSLTLNGGAVTGGGSPAAGSFNLGGDCIANTNLTLAAQNITTASGTTFYVKASNTLTVTGAIIGPGGLNFAGPGNLVLSASNTYAGNTTVSSGSFLVYGALGTGSLTVGGGTFGGAAVIGGPATMLSGANFLISPGVIGGFACNAGLALSAGATTSLKISKSLSTNDQVLVVGTLAYGGTLSVSNLSGTLAAGDAFPVFHATSYTGSFAVITPAVPGAGLVWNTSTLAVDGALRVAAAGPASFGATGLQGADLVLSVTGGPPGSPYHLVTSADVSLPLTNWTPIWSNNFDGNGNGPAWSNTLDTTIPRQFYDVVVP